ncbi:MAG: hypothetical protein V9H26_10925 [Verrucomicrobiota bacterium]|nr:hypothetical protein [Limisphaerales bacterium]
MSNFLEILKSFDDSEHAEYPVGFVHEAAWSKFEKLAQEVCPQYPGSEFETGLRIQDASFHGQIMLKVRGGIAVIRASNFGNLITILDEDSLLENLSMTRLKRIFEKFGYTFVPSEILELDYTGKNGGVNGFRSWRLRFFDYT